MKNLLLYLSKFEKIFFRYLSATFVNILQRERYQIPSPKNIFFPHFRAKKRNSPLSGNRGQTRERPIVAQKMPRSDTRRRRQKILTFNFTVPVPLSIIVFLLSLIFIFFLLTLLLFFLLLHLKKIKSSGFLKTYRYYIFRW